MRIESLERYRNRSARGGGFYDLPPFQRQAAERWYAHFVRRRLAQGKPLEPWLKAIYHGQARRLVRRPPTREWGRRMLAKRGGYAVQRRYLEEGRNPTAQATRMRSLLAARAARRATAAAAPKQPLPDMSISFYEGRLGASSGARMREALAQAIIKHVTDPRTMENAPPMAWRWTLALEPWL